MHLLFCKLILCACVCVCVWGGGILILRLFRFSSFYVLLYTLYDSWLIPLTHPNCRCAGLIKIFYGKLWYAFKPCFQSVGSILFIHAAVTPRGELPNTVRGQLRISIKTPTFDETNSLYIFHYKVDRWPHPSPHHVHWRAYTANLFGMTSCIKLRQYSLYLMKH